MKKEQKLLSIGQDTKTVKGQKFGYLTAILYLAPFTESGVMNVCSNASQGCIAGCLYTAGMGSFGNVRAARVKKTTFLKFHRSEFIAQLIHEITNFIKLAKKKNMIPAVRLNGTSDLPWEAFNIIQSFPDLIFYDYTKNIKRMREYLSGKLPSNYGLTFSRSEKNDHYTSEVIEAGGNVAVVFDVLPKTYIGYKVIDGDQSDLRFLDRTGVIVGLYAKGQARKDRTGFVVRLEGVK